MSGVKKVEDGFIAQLAGFCKQRILRLIQTVLAGQTVYGGRFERLDAIAVDVIRGTAPPLSLPIYTALRERVLLQPGDRVIVRKEPAVIVTMLGAGIRQNGRLSFAAAPTLSVALARAGGLDANIAAANGMFVMRQTVNGRPLLYDFSWNRAGGMLAAQQFPLEANDVVYVAEAPILSIQKVVNTLFQLVLPAQLIK